MVSLLKRSVSTAAACAFTLQAVAMRLDDLANGRDDHAESAAATHQVPARPLARASRYDDLSAQEQQDLVQFESEELAVSLADLDPEELEGNLGSLFGAIAKSRKTEKRAERTRDALQRRGRPRREARSEDPKLHALVSAVREIRRDGARGQCARLHRIRRQPRGPGRGAPRRLHARRAHRPAPDDLGRRPRRTPIRADRPLPQRGRRDPRQHRRERRGS
jgi:hypothetical protein